MQVQATEQGDTCHVTTTHRVVEPWRQDRDDGESIASDTRVEAYQEG